MKDPGAQPRWAAWTRLLLATAVIPPLGIWIGARRRYWWRPGTRAAYLTFACFYLACFVIAGFNPDPEPAPKPPALGLSTTSAVEVAGTAASSAPLEPNAAANSTGSDEEIDRWYRLQRPAFALMATDVASIRRNSEAGSLRGTSDACNALLGSVWNAGALPAPQPDVQAPLARALDMLETAATDCYSRLDAGDADALNDTTSLLEQAGEQLELFREALAEHGIDT